MKKVAAVLLLSAISAAPAFAADEGAYVNIDAGQVAFSNAQTQFSTSNFGNTTGFTIGGGYHFNQNVAVEVGYSIIGEPSVSSPTNLAGINSTEKLKTSSFQVAAVGTLPINEQFSVFGKLGLASTTIDYSASLPAGYGFINPTTVTSTSGSNTNLMFGLGGQFNINRNIGIRLQYLDLGNVQLSGGPNIGVKIISVGGVFNF